LHDLRVTLTELIVGVRMYNWNDVLFRV